MSCIIPYMILSFHVLNNSMVSATGKMQCEIRYYLVKVNTRDKTKRWFVTRFNLCEMMISNVCISNCFSEMREILTWAASGLMLSAGDMI